jgi:hypothetical protein
MIRRFFVWIGQVLEEGSFGDRLLVFTVVGLPIDVLLRVVWPSGLQGHPVLIVLRSLFDSCILAVGWHLLNSLRKGRS